MQQWVTPSGQKLFGSTKDLYKNIQMTCLNVMWLLKARVDEDETVDGLRIASRIMQCIDKDVRDAWLNHEKNAVFFDKCRSRIEEKATGSRIQLEALCFFGQLAGSRTLPQSMVTRYTSCLFSGVCEAESGSVSELLSASLPRFAVSLSYGSARWLTDQPRSIYKISIHCFPVSSMHALNDQIPSTYPILSVSWTSSPLPSCRLPQYEVMHYALCRWRRYKTRSGTLSASN
jgi:hypothetical protein